MDLRQQRAAASHLPAKQAASACLHHETRFSQITQLSALPVTGFTSHHSIDNPNSHVKLTQQPLSTVMDYSKLKVAELKELLKERGISATGLSKKQLLSLIHI